MHVLMPLSQLLVLAATLSSGSKNRPPFLELTDQQQNRLVD